MALSINAFLRENGLTLRSVYSWEATRGLTVVFKLWRRQEKLDSDGNIVVQCLAVQRPASGPNGPRWDQRREAVLKVQRGEWQGFATLGKESQSGKQRIYVDFNVTGFHRVLAIRRADDGSYFATLAPTLVSRTAFESTNLPSKSTCDVLLGNTWHRMAVSELLASNDHRNLKLRCPICHGPVRLEKQSAPGKMQNMLDRFEHKSGTFHDGCPLIGGLKNFNGTVALSPFRETYPVVSYDETSEDKSYVSQAEAADIVRDVPDQTEREQLIKARIGQGRFRIEVLELWKSCSVTNCVAKSLLIASHIVSWREATNAERLDPFNGLLLSPTLDRLFDRHLVSFEVTGEIIISKRLSKTDLVALNIGEGMRLRVLHSGQSKYMELHRKKLQALDGVL